MLANTTLNGSFLIGANLAGANLRGATVLGADLSSANLTGAKLGNVGWNGTVCPNGRRHDDPLLTSLPGPDQRASP